MKSAVMELNSMPNATYDTSFDKINDNTKLDKGIRKYNIHFIF